MSSPGCRFSAALSMSFVKPGFSTVTRGSSVHSPKAWAVPGKRPRVSLQSRRHLHSWSEAELLRIKGDLVLQEGGPNSAGAAEDHFVQALDLARRQGALSWELRVAMSLSRLWDDGGRTKEAL